MKDRIKNLLAILTSKRFAIAVGGIVVLKFLSSPVALVCATVIAVTLIICETFRKA